MRSAASARPLAPLHPERCIRTRAPSSTARRASASTALRRCSRKLAQFIARHPLLRVLERRTELEKRAEVIRCLPREDVDQPSTPGGSSELAYLGGELAVPLLLRRGDQLLPSFDEVIGREGVQLIGGGIDVHETTLRRSGPRRWREVDDRVVDQPGVAHPGCHHKDGRPHMIIWYVGKGCRVDDARVVEFEAWFGFGPIQAPRTPLRERLEPSFELRPSRAPRRCCAPPGARSR